MRSVVVAAACALLSSACATSWVPDKKELASFPDSGSGMIAMTFDGSNLACYSGTTTFIREDGKKERVSITSSSDAVGAAVVVPGKYSVLAASCIGGEYSYTLPNVFMWFASFEVKAGEVVYPGTFIPKAIDVETFRTDGDKAATAILTLGLSLFMESDSNRRQFPTYQFQDRLRADRSKFAADLGPLAEKIVVRKPLQMLSPAAFARAYQRAYAPNADGTAVTEEIGRERLKKEIEVAIRESLAHFAPPLDTPATVDGAPKPAPPVAVKPAPPAPAPPVTAKPAETP